MLNKSKVDQERLDSATHEFVLALFRHVEDGVSIPSSLEYLCPVVYRIKALDKDIETRNSRDKLQKEFPEIAAKEDNVPTASADELLYELHQLEDKLYDVVKKEVKTLYF